MTKSDERAAKARSLIIKGEMQESEIAEMCGYKSIGGMMNAITMLEHREKTGKGVSKKARRSLQSFTPYEGPTTQREQRKADRTFRNVSPWAPVDLLGGGTNRRPCAWMWRETTACMRGWRAGICWRAISAIGNR